MGLKCIKCGSLVNETEKRCQGCGMSMELIRQGHKLVIAENEKLQKQINEGQRRITTLEEMKDRVELFSTLLLENPILLAELKRTARTLKKAIS